MTQKKDKPIQCIGYYTVTRTLFFKERKIKEVNTAKIGFAGITTRAKFQEAAKDLKDRFYKELRRNYPEDERNWKVSVRTTIVECDTILGCKDDNDAASN